MASERPAVIADRVSFTLSFHVSCAFAARKSAGANGAALKGPCSPLSGHYSKAPSFPLPVSFSSVRPRTKLGESGAARTLARKVAAAGTSEKVLVLEVVVGGSFDGARPGLHC